MRIIGGGPDPAGVGAQGPAGAGAQGPGVGPAEILVLVVGIPRAGVGGSTPLKTNGAE